MPALRRPAGTDLALSAADRPPVASAERSAEGPDFSFAAVVVEDRRGPRGRRRARIPPEPGPREIVVSKTSNLSLVPLWTMLWQPCRPRCAAACACPPTTCCATPTYRRLWTLDPDQLVRRPGDDARAAAHGGGAAAGHADADGPADGDGDRCPSCCSRCPRACGSIACASCRSTWSARPALRSSWPACRWPGGWAGCRWPGCTWSASCIGTRLHRSAGTAAQIVLTQVVARERLVEAHAKNALASSGAEVAGPGFAGALIKAGRRAAGAAGRRGAAARLGRHPARHPRQRAARAARRRALLARPARRRALRAPASACWWRWRARWAAGRCATTRRSWCRSCSRRARSACRSRRSA